MLITKEEFDIEMARKNAQIEEYSKALDDTMKELVETQKLLKAKKAAADDGYYIHVPVEPECIDCPKLELITEKQTMYANENVSSVAYIHKCKHLDFCQAIRRNWERVHEIEEDKEKAPE